MAVTVSIGGRGAAAIGTSASRTRLPGWAPPGSSPAALPAGETYTAGYRILAKPRGVYRVGPVRVSVADPLHLAASDTDRPAMPTGSSSTRRSSNSRAFPLVRGLNPALHATRPEFSHRGGEDFFTLREYRIGDDLRRVHWPSTAKRDELMIRQLETPWQSRALVLLDVRRTSYENRAAFERAVSGAASTTAPSRDATDSTATSGPVRPT